MKAAGLDALSLGVETGNAEQIEEHWKDKMLGLDAVKAIRASGNQTPIVMVTTEAEKHRIMEAVQAGINDYLVKPFTPDALLEKTKKFMG